jgi:hypothetical protein
MSVMNMNANDIVRQGIAGISEAHVLETVDNLNLKGNAKLSAVVAMPLRSLQQKRDVSTFAATAPIAAVRALLEVLAFEPLENIVEALGDDADAPTYEQLKEAVDHIVAQGATNDDVLAVLTFGIGEGFPAAPHCRQLLDERPELALGELVTLRAPSLLVPKQVSDEVKEQRRIRREEEKKKKSATSARANHSFKAKRSDRAPAPSSSTAVANSEPIIEVLRRRVLFTPAELSTFDPSHPLVGTVILADVPFDATDPVMPEQRSKLRPAIVVAANDDAVLVLGIYSNDSPTRNLFQPWRKLGLAHVSYVATDRTVVTLAPRDAERIGRLSDEEWNSLF